MVNRGIAEIELIDILAQCPVRTEAVHIIWNPAYSHIAQGYFIIGHVEAPARIILSGLEKIEW